MKIKYIKACPFLRDLGDSYLCVNNDKVADVILDPLMHIEWSEELPPVASEMENVITCLFVLDIQNDGKLYCPSRKMFLKMDNRFILWEDIRDSVILLKLTGSSEVPDSEVDFCSTCLYKVLIASSPAFQHRLSKDQKTQLGWKYILNKANETYYSINNLLTSFTDNTRCIEDKRFFEKEIDNSISTTYEMLFNIMAYLRDVIHSEVDFAANSVEWYQRFDEWRLVITKIADVKTNPERIDLIVTSNEYAQKLKEISFDLVMKISFIERDAKDDVLITLKNAERIFTVASVQFEDYTFICNQYLAILKENGEYKD